MFEVGLSFCVQPNLEKRVIGRQSPDLLEKMNEKYARVLRTIVNNLPERAPQTDPVLKALQTLENS